MQRNILGETQRGRAVVPSLLVVVAGRIKSFAFCTDFFGLGTLRRGGDVLMFLHLGEMCLRCVRMEKGFDFR